MWLYQLSRSLNKPAIRLGLFGILSGLLMMQADAAQYSVEQLHYAEKIRESSALENKAYTLLESLTTEVGPRMAGSAGDAKAVAWAQAKFRQLGFDKVWTEPVSSQYGNGDQPA